jgi:AcrR family transcriptional regulator
LLRDHDHDQIQMKDVACAAGVALGTVYRYFQSKEHLFAEALAHWGSELRAHIERKPLSGTTNAERLTDVLQRSMRAFESWPQLGRVVMSLESSDDPFTREVFARNMAYNFDVYVESLQGLPRELATEVVRVAVAVFDLQLRQWVTGAHSVDVAQDRIARAVEVIFHFSDPAQKTLARRPSVA